MCGETCPGQEYCQICAKDDISKQVVDFIEGFTYQEIDLDQDPCIFPQCKHIITLSNMDGQMDLAACYNLAENGIPLSIKCTEPFSEQLKKVPTCPSCRGSLRDICRYGRIVRRALLDEGTKRFASRAQAEYVPLAESFHTAEQLLSFSADHFDTTSQRSSPPLRSLGGKRGAQIQQILNIPAVSTRYAKLKKLRPSLLRYRDKVQKDETPVEKVWHMVEAARRRQGKPTVEAGLDGQVSLTTFHVMAESLLLRFDITVLADFLNQLSVAPMGFVDPAFTVDLSSNRADCTWLLNTAKASKDHEREVEGHIFYARYCALEISYAISPARAEALRLAGTSAIDLAHFLCKRYGGRVEALVPEVKAVERSLIDGTFMSPVTSDERRAILFAMRTELGATGRWYNCQNGHPFTVGNCGMPMELARCPICGEAIGGRDHRPAEGVGRAEDLEREFAEFRL